MSDAAIIVVTALGVVQGVIVAALGAVVAWMQKQTKDAVIAGNAKAAEDAASAAAKAEQVKAAAIRAAVKVEEVKAVLQEDKVAIADKLASLADVAEKSHGLLNSGDLVRRGEYAAVMRRLAKITRDQGDIEAADEAESVYRKHQAKQAEVDAKEGGK